MDGVGSFGAGRAGAAFDPFAFIQQPTTILRILSWVRHLFRLPTDNHVSLEETNVVCENNPEHIHIIIITFSSHAHLII